MPGKIRVRVDHGIAGSRESDDVISHESITSTMTTRIKKRRLCLAGKRVTDQ